jgi:hypothetical protein
VPALPWAVKLKKSYVTSIQADWNSFSKGMKMNKIDKVIEKALEKYKPAAEDKVKQKLCASCTDKECEAGILCYAYALLVKIVSCSLASSSMDDN